LSGFSAHAGENARGPCRFQHDMFFFIPRTSTAEWNPFYAERLSLRYRRTDDAGRSRNADAERGGGQ
jgi:hypothetical protein